MFIGAFCKPKWTKINRNADGYKEKTIDTRQALQEGTLDDMPIEADLVIENQILIDASLEENAHQEAAADLDESEKSDTPITKFRVIKNAFKANLAWEAFFIVCF